MTDPRIIEAGAEAAYHATPRNKPYDKLTLFKKNLYRAESAAVITAYKAHLAAEGFVVVRAEPTEAMWGGLARDLVMWDRGMPNQYGSTLYKHLRASGKPIPDWLLAEIPDIDHTPPKGTVAVCIYKAMIRAAAQEPSNASD